MQTVRLIGRFMHSDGTTAQGDLRILPVKLWRSEKGKLLAYRGAEVTLEDGCFDVEVSVGEHIISTPFARWRVNVPSSKQPLFLKDLIVEANAT